MLRLFVAMLPAEKNLALRRSRCRRHREVCIISDSLQCWKILSAIDLPLKRSPRSFVALYCGLDVELVHLIPLQVTILRKLYCSCTLLAISSNKLCPWSPIYININIHISIIFEGVSQLHESIDQNSSTSICHIDQIVSNINQQKPPGIQHFCLFVTSGT